MRKWLVLAGCLLCMLTASACAAVPFDHPWSMGDLRWLGGLDAPTAATDILAVYTRTSSLTVDIRLDLLDITPKDNYQFRLSLWDEHVFVDAPLTVDLDSTGAIRVGGDGTGKPLIWPRVVRDFEADTVTFSFNRFLLGPRYRLDVVAYTLAPLAVADQARNILSEDQPPVQRAPVLLAFWNTFPAQTPAQALRRWDGAHTGPMGGRHGLRYILEASSQNGIPVALLDLKVPASMAALDYLGQTGRIRQMAGNGLLILPDVAYSDPASLSLASSRLAAGGFNLPPSNFVFSSAGRLLPSSSTQFLSLPDSSHLMLSGGKRLIPMPDSSSSQVTVDGPTMEVRKALVNALLSPEPGDLVVLGGSLPDSLWGNPDMANSSFGWLAAHPWIQPLNAESLAVFPARVGDLSSISTSEDISPLLTAIQSVPANAARQSALDMFLTLNEPTVDSKLAVLRADYMPQVDGLLAGAEWAAAPSSRDLCGDVLDGIQGSVCLLSNDRFFAVLDPAGARLVFLFYLDAGGVHQLVGPSSQFALGLSDPSEWHPEAGLRADPSVIPGAFSETVATWLPYNASPGSEDISFTAADGSGKIFRLSENGLEVTYHLFHPVTTRIPLALDPQAYYSGPVFYQPTILPHEWLWSRQGGIAVCVLTDADISAQGFVSSYPFLFMSEDPNLDYPSGHYLPFPLSLVTIQGQGDFSVSISVLSER